MNGFIFSFAIARPRPIAPSSWLPRSYRAHAVQEDVRATYRLPRVYARSLDGAEAAARSARARRNVAMAILLALVVVTPLGMLHWSEVGPLLMRGPNLIVAWVIGIGWTLAAVIRNRQSEEPA